MGNLIRQEHLKLACSLAGHAGVSVWKGYSCDTCKGMYKTPEEAAECFQQEVPISHAVGDIVVQSYSMEEGGDADFGWFDGDIAWIARDTTDGGMHGGQGYCFYYVVTAVMTSAQHRPHEDSRGDHDMVYVVRTLAMSEKSGYVGGWTTGENHVRMSKVKDPPAVVVEQSKALIGWVTDSLL